MERGVEVGGYFDIHIDQNHRGGTEFLAMFLSLYAFVHEEFYKTT